MPTSSEPPLSFEPSAEAAMRECAVGGLMVTTNRPVAEQADGRSVDGNVQVLFRRTLDHSRFTNEWHRLDQAGSPVAYFREDGRRVEVEDGGASVRDYAAELRRVVPFASALQGKVVLHGSAVGFEGSVITFLGGSGAGKSTLADALREEGLDRIADDLLPARVRENLVVVPWLERDAKIYLPLAALYFLSRSRSKSNLVITPLEKKDAFVALCQNSFGELRSSASWRAQFQGMGHIADRVAAFTLVLPDDIGGLPVHAEHLRRDVFPTLKLAGSSS